MARPSSPCHPAYRSLTISANCAALDDGGGVEESTRHGIDSSDVRIKEIGRVDALPPELGVEVVAAGGETSTLQDVVESRGDLANVVRELVGIPAVLRIAPIHVDRSEHAQRDRGRDLVLKAVAGEGCVVGLDIELHFLFEAVGEKESVDGFDIAVVLVLGGFVGLRLDQNGPLKADAVLVFDHHFQEAAELRLLLLEIGVEQAVVALASAPQDVVLAAETLGQFDAVPHLGGSEPEHIRIRVGSRAGHVARVAEEIGGAPKQLHAGGGHLLADAIADACKIVDVLAYGVGLGHDIRIVKAEVREAEAGEELESFVQLVFRMRLIHGSTVPGTVERAGPEHVGALAAEGVPVADRHAKMVLHRFAEDDAVLVVVAIGERVFGRDALELNPRDGGEVRL